MKSSRLNGICKICGEWSNNVSSHVRWKHKEEKSFTCTKCGKKFQDNCGFAGHTKHCNGIKVKKTDWKCPLCNMMISKSCKKDRHLKICNGLGPRGRRPRKAPLDGSSMWKGKTWEDRIGVERARQLKLRQSEYCIRNGVGGRCSDPEKEKIRCEKISKIAKEKHFGGYRRGSGRGKKGWYKGYWCDSSWELAWIIYSLDHGILFERNHKKYKYTWNNEEHSYIPDFRILNSNEFVEIKGYMTEQCKTKIEEFRKSTGYILTIIDVKTINTFLDYAKNKFGDNFIQIYEKVK